MGLIPVGNAHTSSVENATYEDAVVASRIVEITSNQQFRGDYGSSTDGLPDYTGHAPKGLAEGTTGWLLKSYTYDANRQCTQILIGYGTWTGRAGVSYS